MHDVELLLQDQALASVIQSYRQRQLEQDIPTEQWDAYIGVSFEVSEGNILGIPLRQEAGLWPDSWSFHGTFGPRYMHKHDAFCRDCNSQRVNLVMSRRTSPRPPVLCEPAGYPLRTRYEADIRCLDCDKLTRLHFDTYGSLNLLQRKLES